MGPSNPHSIEILMHYPPIASYVRQKLMHISTNKKKSERLLLGHIMHGIYQRYCTFLVMYFSRINSSEISILSKKLKFNYAFSCICRHFIWKRWNLEQLQLVSRQDNPVERNHYQPNGQISLRVPVQRGRERVHPLPRVLWSWVLGRGASQLPKVLQNQLQVCFLVYTITNVAI